MTDAPQSLVERLREMAKRISYFSHGLNSDDTPITPIAPEETLEGQAGAALEALEREVAELKEAHIVLTAELSDADEAIEVARAQVREQAAEVCDDLRCATCGHAIRAMPLEG